MRGVRSIPALASTSKLSINSPKTSSCVWPAAALPMRTGRRALIAGQPVQLVFLQAAAAIDPIDDLHRRGLACDRAQDPVTPARRLFVEAGVEQRGQREGGVAQPAVAIVPVRRSARNFGQSKRRGGDDPAAFPIDQRAQRDQRASHSAVPAAFRLEPADPALPLLLRRLDQGINLQGRGQRRRRWRIGRGRRRSSRPWRARSGRWRRRSPSSVRRDSRGRRDPGRPRK